MKKLIVSGLLALGLAFAQGRVFVEAFGGELSIVPSFGLAAGISAGKTKMVGPMDLRGSVNVFLRVAVVRHFPWSLISFIPYLWQVRLVWTWV